MIRTLFFSFLIGALSTPIQSQQIEINANLALDEDLQRALYVRWVDSNEIYLTTAQNKFWKIQLEDSAKGRKILAVSPIPGPAGMRSTIVRASKDTIIVSDKNKHFAWRPISSAAFYPHKKTDFIVDLDVYQNKILTLGAQYKDGKWSPDGVLAWLTTFSKSETDPRLQAVTYAQEPSAQLIGKCGWLDFAGARFLPGGWFVVFPGIDPFVYLHKPDGKLHRVWNTTKLGIDTGCNFLDNIDDERPHMDTKYRYEKINNRRRILDAIVPLSESFGLIVRFREGDKIRWHLIELHYEGKSTRHHLNFSSSSPYSDMDADFSSGEFVFVMSEGNNRNNPKPSRLLFARLPTQSQ